MTSARVVRSAIIVLLASVVSSPVCAQFFSYGQLEEIQASYAFRRALLFLSGSCLVLCVGAQLFLHRQEKKHRREGVKIKPAGTPPSMPREPVFLKAIGAASDLLQVVIGVALLRGLGIAEPDETGSLEDEETREAA